ncbi:hypothetical protein [Lysobacter sp. Root690]|uniref:hypothetical protein n=1 Tax=Lysobacter sp. Root690 TaxID=1736588 RepID=UPI0006F8CEA8|nr:hypothetical protein [Lysobacter sp. Root690]KRB03437.1 hypothetical protein ASD86_21455 [Lysobacter sp. Root690]
MSDPQTPPPSDNSAATTAFDLRAMAALLAQGRHLRNGSLIVLAATLLGLVWPGVDAIPAWLLLSLGAGLAQLYYAVRVDFDAKLLAALADHGDGSEAGMHAARRLDASLIALELLPRDRAGRDWPARWRGARGLLRNQALCLLAQLAMLVAAYGRVWL